MADARGENYYFSRRPGATSLAAAEATCDRLIWIFGLAVQVRAGCGRGVSVCGERAPRDGINDGPREDVMVGGEGRKEEK